MASFALTLVASDNKALNVMVGNAGLPPTYPPAQFVTEKLMACARSNCDWDSRGPQSLSPGSRRRWSLT
jgi:hypothetical protein